MMKWPDFITWISREIEEWLDDNFSFLPGNTREIILEDVIWLSNKLDSDDYLEWLLRFLQNLVKIKICLEEKSEISKGDNDVRDIEVPQFGFESFKNIVAKEGWKNDEDFKRLMDSIRAMENYKLKMDRELLDFKKYLFDELKP